MKNERSSFAKLKADTLKAADKFCWRGYRTLTACPICLKIHLSIEEARLLTEAFASPINSKLVEAVADAHDVGLLILVPRKPKIAKLLDHRLVLGPICRDHSEIDGAEIERWVLLASKYGKKVRGGPL